MCWFSNKNWNMFILHGIAWLFSKLRKKVYSKRSLNTTYFELVSYISENAKWQKHMKFTGGWLGFERKTWQKRNDWSAISVFYYDGWHCQGQRLWRQAQKWCPAWFLPPFFAFFAVCLDTEGVMRLCIVLQHQFPSRHKSHTLVWQEDRLAYIPACWSGTTTVRLSDGFRPRLLECLVNNIRWECP